MRLFYNKSEKQYFITINLKDDVDLHLNFNIPESKDFVCEKISLSISIGDISYSVVTDECTPEELLKTLKTYMD